MKTSNSIQCMICAGCGLLLMSATRKKPYTTPINKKQKNCLLNCQKLLYVF